jgi:hypothetical protein
LQIQVLGPIHFGHTALTEDGDYFVLTQCLADHLHKK